MGEYMDKNPAGESGFADGVFGMLKPFGFPFGIELDSDKIDAPVRGETLMFLPVTAGGGYDLSLFASGNGFLRGAEAGAGQRYLSRPPGSDSWFPG